MLKSLVTKYIIGWTSAYLVGSDETTQVFIDNDLHKTSVMPLNEVIAVLFELLYPLLKDKYEVKGNNFWLTTFKIISLFILNSLVIINHF